MGAPHKRRPPRAAIAPPRSLTELVVAAGYDPTKGPIVQVEIAHVDKTRARTERLSVGNSDMARAMFLFLVHYLISITSRFDMKDRSALTKRLKRRIKLGKKARGELVRLLTEAKVWPVTDPKHWVAAFIQAHWDDGDLFFKIQKLRD